MTIFELKNALMKSENLSEDTKKIISYEIDKIVEHNDKFSFMEYEHDGCVYEDVEEYPDCTVTISKCIKCGKIDVSWRRNDGQEY